MVSNSHELLLKSRRPPPARSPRYAEQHAMRWAGRRCSTGHLRVFHGATRFPRGISRLRACGRIRDNKPATNSRANSLGGDLRPNATMEQRWRRRNNRFNRTSAEGGFQPKEYLGEVRGGPGGARQVAVWMGPRSAARNATPLFDPFTARDFYSMKAFFADIQRRACAGSRPCGVGLPAFARYACPAARLVSRKHNWNRRRATLRSKLRPWTPHAPSGKQPAAHVRSGRTWRGKRSIRNRQRRSTGTPPHDPQLRRNVDLTLDDGAPISRAFRAPGNGLLVSHRGRSESDNETYTVTMRPLWARPGYGAGSGGGACTVSARQCSRWPRVRTDVVSEVESEIVRARVAVRFGPART